MARLGRRTADGSVQNVSGAAVGGCPQLRTDWVYLARGQRQRPRLSTYRFEVFSVTTVWTIRRQMWALTGQRLRCIMVRITMFMRSNIGRAIGLLLASPLPYVGSHS